MVFRLLGLAANEVPYEDGQRAMVEFIQKHYPNILLSDISESFEAAITNKFLINPLNPANDMGLYGKVFSAEYFGRIINPYLEYKKSIPAPKKPEPLQIEDKRTKEEKQDAALRITIETIKELKKIPEILMVKECFASLWRNGKLDLSDEKKKQVRKQAEVNFSEMRDELVRKGRAQESAELRKNYDTEVRDEMKNIYVREYLQTIEF